MTSVINNDAFTELSPKKAKRDRDAKSPNDRYGSSRRDRPQTKNGSPDRKKERPDPPPRTKPYNSGTAVDTKGHLQRLWK